ncbi:hypothetical protein HS088_TW18G01127 [Tripterygium wilfordii]|uniref:Uncharacterized protein n=1 Tax=Tripterygium wilfordii TaxID=458696 RepID=A0A7J7CEA0_TRIWF|nr:uncharacterized protein At4g00950-like [Tripterygium wilfordii]KAF5732432.1 hypothetical protein HS088_TW18G01127 [Tripterygium wilfordii]
MNRRSMGFPDPPKLSLFSLPNKPNHEEPPGFLTPPLRTSASVPFQWEEAPGRPRPSTIAHTKPKLKNARSLDLPPRLLINEDNSPTTVLDGPYMGKGGWSFRRSPSEIWGPKKDRPAAIFFGSTRWRSFKKSTKEAVGSSSFDYFSSSSSIAADKSSTVGSNGNPKLRITRIRRRTSFMRFSDKLTRSNVWASIYESFKQVVPWRRRHN